MRAAHSGASPSANARWTMIRRLTDVLGGRHGIVLFAVAVGGWLLQAVVECGVAVLLLLLLRTLGLLASEAIPSWLPAWVAGSSSARIWIGLVALALLQSALQAVSFQCRILLTEQVQARLRMTLTFEALHRNAPPSLSRLTYYSAEIFPQSARFVYQLTQVACLAVHASALVLAMFWVAPGAALVAVAGMAVLAPLLLYFNRLNTRAAAHLLTSQDAYERSKVRMSQNWLLIRALRLERQEHLAQVAASADYYRYSVLAFFFGNLGAAIGPLLAMALLAAVLFVHISVLHGQPAALVPFLYLLFRLQNLLAHTSNYVGGLFTYGNHIRETARFLDAFTDSELAEALVPQSALHARHGRVTLADVLPEPPSADLRNATAAAPPVLRVQHLGFAWPDNPAPVFWDLNVELAAGAQLGINGPNGSGKSTFLAILLGVLRPRQGSVLLDDIEAAVWVGSQRAVVGFVGSDPYLLHGSLRENLEYGLGRRVAAAELFETLERVHLSQRVASLPSGLDHQLEEGGAGLSAGEQQKLAIARALLRRPRLLVLDEPTAHVDDTAEREIIATLRQLRGSCTVVLVSHNAEVLLHADQRLTFDPAPDAARDWDFGT